MGMYPGIMGTSETLEIQSAPGYQPYPELHWNGSLCAKQSLQVLGTRDGEDNLILTLSICTLRCLRLLGDTSAPILR